METLVTQTTKSQATDERQVPASTVKKAPEGHTGWSPETGLDGTLDKVRAYTETSVRKGFMQPDVPVSTDLEEFFEAFVDEITDSALRLRTITSKGEEGIAWLPIDKIPASEQTYIELGAPLRISIVLDRGPRTNERRTHVRFLRPFQWRSTTSAEKATDYLLERMKAVLGER
jgi:hypothetical protein